MKILAIDFGFKRIGVAVGDTDLKIAFPRAILNHPGDFDILAQTILEMCGKEGVQRVLVGYPENYGVDESEQCEVSLEFADDLEDYFLKNNSKIQVEFINEAFSTKIAEKKMHEIGMDSRHQKGKKDSFAAQVFLQSYFDALE